MSVISVEKIWSIGEKLQGVYMPHEYGNVIIPLTLIKRLDSCNEQNDLTFNDVVNSNEVLNDFKKYLKQFSEDIIEILGYFDFNKSLEKMNKNNILRAVLQEFNEINLHPLVIPSVEMGYLFEKLVSTFSENYIEDRGAHYTPEDIITLMSKLLLMDNEKENVSCYDMTMGNGQMLFNFKTFFENIYGENKVEVFGQELHDMTIAMGKIDLIIKGENPNNFRLGNTLSDDKFKGYLFDYIIGNPPFGVGWKTEKKIIDALIKKKEDDRFLVGKPNVGDSQMLFTLNGLSKLNDNGKMALVHNGSWLFSGAAGGGESEIRRHLIENDYLDCVIQLPKNLFYNTEITTYILIITKNKKEERKGKVQLIDASKCFEKRRKANGKKRVDITENNIETIVKVYNSTENEKIENTISSKWFKNIDFGFYKVTVDRPKKDEEGNVLYEKGKMIADSELRDTETIPLTETIDEYMAREVLPYAPDAWVDETKTKVGYEIPFTRHFYEYVPPRPSQELLTEIIASEEKISALLKELLGNE